MERLVWRFGRESPRMRSTKGLPAAFVAAVFVMAWFCPPARATNAAPGCLGIGVGLLDSYFDVPWSASEMEKFATVIAEPSAASFWGVDKQNSQGHVETLISPGGGLKAVGHDTAFAIYQPLDPPKLIPGYEYLLIDVLARVFVRQGHVGIALTAGPASFAAQAYPRAPFRSMTTGEWNTIGVQVMVSANSPPFDRVSIVALDPVAEFSLGCITFVTHERNIGVPDPGPPTKGASLLLPLTNRSGFAVIQQQ
jgi:hypothetical protein